MHRSRRDRQAPTGQVTAKPSAPVSLADCSTPVADLDTAEQSEYIGLMIATLRESKAKLSALVESAARGEEVVITVRGKPRARLCPMVRASALEQRGSANWAKSLRAARETYSVGTHDTGTAIVEALRGDRV